MAYVAKRSRIKSYCSHCGAEIKWLRGKGTVKEVPVEPHKLYFLLDSDGHTFIAADGCPRTGRESCDGLVGYIKHDCPAMPSHRKLSEKELLARQWA